MAYFECIVGNGGGGTTDIPLIVNCDEAFAGLTITATQGQTSFTETCPSTSPYQVVFHLPVDGTWVISGTIEGTPYSESITISAFEIDLKAGFDYKAWLTAGGLNPSDYASLAAVFADEAATRQLMLVHASADYLAGKVSGDVDTLDDFVANDTAMKWLGLCDYVCDGIVAITGAEAKLLGSTYWERYLKDHVPTMTSNTAPYGTIIYSSDFGGAYPCWKVFDGDKTTGGGPTNAVGAYVGYKFVNPINIKKAVVRFRTGNTDTFKIQVSSDNFTSDIRDVDTITNPTLDTDYVIDFSSDYGYVTSARLYQTTKNSSTGGTSIFHLQFYGRSLDVSVPAMTSDTLPYGEASGSSVYSASYNYYNAFDKLVTSTKLWLPATNETPSYVSYEFPSKFLAKKAHIKTAINGSPSAVSYKIEAYDGSNWIALTENQTLSAAGDITLDLNSNGVEYSKFRFYCADRMTQGGTTYFAIYDFNVFGVSYSEKEFEAGTTKKWLYDHGVELETFTAYTTGASVEATKNDDNLFVSIPASTQRNAAFATELDLTAYDLYRIKVGDVLAASSASDYPNMVIYSQAPNYSGNGRLSVQAMAPSTNQLPNNLSLDISSYDASYLIGIQASNNTSAVSRSAKATEIWLE